MESIEEIGSKWKLIVLNDLRDDEKRFNELKRSTGAKTILDTRRTLDRTEGELDNQGLRRSAEAHFDNAQQQFDRARASARHKDLHE